MDKKATNPNAKATASKNDKKQAFVAPKLRRHEDLPEITGITFGGDDAPSTGLAV